MIPIALISYTLGVFSCAALLLILASKRPKAPTMRRRKAKEEPARDADFYDVGTVDYRFINLTGLEDK